MMPEILIETFPDMVSNALPSRPLRQLIWGRTGQAGGEPDNRRRGRNQCAVGPL